MPGLSRPFDFPADINEFRDAFNRDIQFTVSMSRRTIREAHEALAAADAALQRDAKMWNRTKP